MSTPKARVQRGAGIVNGLDMQVLQVQENVPPGSPCAGTVAMVARDRVAAQATISWLMTDLSWLKPGEHHKRYIVVGNVLTFQRNQCINDMEGDWILFIDSDMVWQPAAMRVLIETREKYDLDIVGGLCFQRSDAYQPTMYKRTSYGYTYLERWPEDAAVEVDVTGMAFCLIHRRVFDRILQHKVGEGFASFEERQKQVPAPFFRWEGDYGEDFQFCRDAQEAGCHIFVDTSVKVGHVGDQVITEETFLRELSFRDPEAQLFREMALSDIGEQALGRQEARERLGWTKA
jgi:hypothetical protein